MGRAALTLQHHNPLAIKAPVTAGIHQQPARSPMTFADGPGGKRLPPPPGQAHWPWID